jgi:8-oxo-dGTP pyrophosphatase MutT (NUDIX family)
MSQRTIFSGKIIRLVTESVSLPNGELAEFEIVHHPGGAAVVALDDTMRVCLLHQYRHAVGGWVWELPAGKLDQGERPLDCARRELEEEAGCRAQDWQSLGKIISSPGVFTEVVHLFLARALQPVPARAEAHEVFELHWIDWREALSRAERGEIEDAKTLAGLFRARASLENG